MLPKVRRAQILQEVLHAGQVSVDDLARRLDVSESTIRRDLNLLDRTGQLQRVRGGGVIEDDRIPFREVAAFASAEKDAIAQRAADLVKDRDVVILDIGTTAAAVARRLKGRAITVVTASLAVVDELRDSTETEVIVLGGVLRQSYLSLVGTLTELSLSQLSADIAFVGTSGIRADGVVLDSTGMEVPIKKAVRRATNRLVLVAAQDKFPGSGVLPVYQAHEIDTLVTNVGDHPTVDVLTQAGAEVLHA